MSGFIQGLCIRLLLGIHLSSCLPLAPPPPSKPTLTLYVLKTCSGPLICRLSIITPLNRLKRCRRSHRCRRQVVGRWGVGRWASLLNKAPRKKNPLLLSVACLSNLPCCKGLGGGKGDQWGAYVTILLQSGSLHSPANVISTSFIDWHGYPLRLPLLSPSDCILIQTLCAQRLLVGKTKGSSAYNVSNRLQWKHFHLKITECGRK